MDSARIKAAARQDVVYVGEVMVYAENGIEEIQCAKLPKALVACQFGAQSNPIRPALFACLIKSGPF